VAQAQQLVPERIAALKTVVPAASMQASGAEPTTMNLDLCGVGPVTVRVPPAGSNASHSDLLPRPLFELPVLDAWTKVLATMEADPSERSRAAALVLRAQGLPRAKVGQSVPVTAMEVPQYALQLARMAASTRDASVLGWALSLCEAAPDAAECRALSAQQLVSLAPDDGRNWLLLAADDPTRRHEALRRAATAPIIGSLPALWPSVAAAAPEGLAPYILADLLSQAQVIVPGLPDRAMASSIGMCLVRPTPELRVICTALADAVQQRSQDLPTLGLGEVLGRRLGWSAEKVSAASTRRSAS
jgi:hypothetical protein